MRRALIIGKTNVGKTLLCVRFAEFMGLRRLEWILERTDGSTEERQMSLMEAEHILAAATQHSTKCFQSIRVQFPYGKTRNELLLTDTTGLTDGIPSDATIRRAMAQTLQAASDAQILLHVVDANAIAHSMRKYRIQDLNSEAWSELDEQIAAYGATHPGYLLLANKIDLPESEHGYEQLRRRFIKRRIVPVSALTGAGFQEVKQLVWRLA